MIEEMSEFWQGFLYSGVVLISLSMAVFTGFLIAKARRGELDAWLNRHNA